MWILLKYQYLTRLVLVKKITNNSFSYLEDGYKIKPIHIMLPKTTTYIKGYDAEINVFFG